MGQRTEVLTHAEIWLTKKQTNKQKKQQPKCRILFEKQTNTNFTDGHLVCRTRHCWVLHVLTSLSCFKEKNQPQRH